MLCIFRYRTKEQAKEFSDSLKKEGYKKIRIIADPNSPDFIIEAEAPNKTPNKRK
ncbi:MAG: hypothetical protein WC776_04945 [Patescibacteria group bacterium]|jgi:hypothetical protein